MKTRLHPACRRAENNARAFSLFEIVISMAILALLSGTIFGIVWKTADVAGEIRVYDTRDEQVARFLGLLRETVETLPSGATLEMVPPEETGTAFYDMTVTGAPTAFTFGERSLGDGDTIIGVRAQTDPSRDPAFEDDAGDTPPLFEVAISREDFAPRDADGDGMVFGAGGDSAFLQADEKGRYWLPLLDDVTAVSWRFWDEAQRLWLDRWTQTDRLPELLELSLDDRYRPAPLVVVFEVPAHLSSPATQAQSTSGGNTGGGSSGAARSDGAGRPTDGPPRTDRPGRGQGRMPGSTIQIVPGGTIQIVPGRVPGSGRGQGGGRGGGNGGGGGQR